VKHFVQLNRGCGSLIQGLVCLANMGDSRSSIEDPMIKISGSMRL
jgi:hypothetical protein